MGIMNIPHHPKVKSTYSEGSIKGEVEEVMPSLVVRIRLDEMDNARLYAYGGMNIMVEKVCLEW